jgi:tRNA(Ile)-lysidine synthase
MSITEQFKNYIQDQHLFHSKDRLLLAVSGGVDSVVLCELCKQAGYDFAIAHCNFKLRESDSDHDEQFVRELAQKYAAPFFVQQFDTTALAKAGKKSVEETARNLRYAWFEEIRAANGYTFIVTAHHANDQVETVLMNFFRGTGLKGLHGIPPKRDKIVRPLLFAKKNELVAFAAEHALAFVQDHTNAQNDFTRNYFRNEIIPAVQKVFPAVEDNLLNNISRLSEAEALYNEAIALHKKKLLEVKGTEVHIPVLKLLQLQPLHSILYEIIKAVVFATIVFNPWGKIYLYGALGVASAVYAVLYVVYCVYMGKRGGDNINHDAHLWGSLFGLAFTLVLIGILQPDLFSAIVEELKNPSLLGR